MKGPTERTTVRRLSERGAYDRATIHAILDEALISHVGFIADGSPFVIPMIHARVDDTLYLHGSPASRMLRTVRGTEICVTATLVDGIVLARSTFHSSMNYRSVVVLGIPREVSDAAEKMRAVEAITEHVAAGRWVDARPVTDKELRSTLVVALDVDEASAKVRTGPPIDDDADYELPIWAGVIPLHVEAGAPIVDPNSVVEVAAPPYAAHYRRTGPRRT